MDDGDKKVWADRLLRYVDSCTRELQRDMILTLKEEKDFYLAQAVFALFLSGVDQAKAVAYCVREGLGVASRTCLRSLVEITTDVRLMLHHNDCFENAVRFLTTANLELLKTMEEKNIKGPKSKNYLVQNLTDYEQLYPKAVGELRKEFQSRGFIKHWSGLSYRKRLSSIPGAQFPGLHFTYSVLSWDAHAKLAAFRIIPKLRAGMMQWRKLEEEDERDMFPYVETAGMVFNSLSSAVFSSAILREKTRKTDKKGKRTLRSTARGVEQG